MEIPVIVKELQLGRGVEQSNTSLCSHHMPNSQTQLDQGRGADGADGNCEGISKNEVCIEPQPKRALGSLIRN